MLQPLPGLPLALELVRHLIVTLQEAKASVAGILKLLLQFLDFDGHRPNLCPRGLARGDGVADIVLVIARQLIDYLLQFGAPLLIEFPPSRFFDIELLPGLPDACIQRVQIILRAVERGVQFGDFAFVIPRHPLQLAVESLTLLVELPRQLLSGAEQLLRVSPTLFELLL